MDAGDRAHSFEDTGVGRMESTAGTAAGKSARQPQRDEIECFLLAGKLLMQSGAETSRVEDTMLRMAVSQGYAEAVSYATTTGIFFTAGYDAPTQIVYITRRAIDLGRIARVNDISRKVVEHKMTVQEALTELRRMEQTALGMRAVWNLLFAALACGSFIVLFQGKLSDIPAAAAAGGIGFLAYLLFLRATKIKFFAEFIASTAVGCAAGLAVASGIGTELDKIVISAVMPLVPGVPIVNAVRDLMAGHMVSGMTKGTEALLTAVSIGAGIAVALSLKGVLF